MSKILQKLSSLVTGSQSPVSSGRLTNRDLIRLESKIGATLFGPVPKGHRREFFCLDEDTWVWYEEWTDPSTRKKMSATTRYEVHDDGILKVQEGHPYKFVEGPELHNLIWAMHMYYEAVARHVYKRDPATGQPLQPHQAAR